MTANVRAIIALLVITPLMLVMGLPALVYAIHGLGIWPPGADGFIDNWWRHWARFDLAGIARALWTILSGQSALFGTSGAAMLMLLTIITAVLVLAYALTAPTQRRTVAGGQLGKARFATNKELAAARRGIELGLAPCSKQPVRVALEGNALTFAPPRTGKTSGLILPNLVGADRHVWQGPAIVIDPKGELYRMVADRRRSMGRRVLCLDPYGIAGGTDRWNPLAGITPSQTADLSRMIGAMLVETGETNLYFRQRATAVVRGALVNLLEDGPTTPEAVRDLLLDKEDLIDRSAAGNSLSVRVLRDILAMDERASAPILSTAQTAFDWLQDGAMENVSGTSTFALEEVVRGQADLFIVVPTDNGDLLAPWLRLVLGEVFAAARRRRQPGDDRVVLFVDEAAVLKRFGQLMAALGELPGYGLSIWSFWQTRGQIKEHYGEAGLETFLGTAEITTVSDVSPTLTEEAASWSAAIGSQTEAVETVNQMAGQGSGGTSRTPQRLPLMQPEAVSAMTMDELLAFIRVRDGIRRPTILKKNRPHIDSRFAGTYVSTSKSPKIAG